VRSAGDDAALASSFEGNPDGIFRLFESMIRSHQELLSGCKALAKTEGIGFPYILLCESGDIS
jgi:hypothetical protein